MEPHDDALGGAAATAVMSDEELARFNPASPPMTPPARSHPAGPQPRRSACLSPLSPTSASVERHLRVANMLLQSPQVQEARRSSGGWSRPVSPESLQRQLRDATRHSRRSSRGGGVYEPPPPLTGDEDAQQQQQQQQNPGAAPYPGGGGRGHTRHRSSRGPTLPSVLDDSVAGADESFYAATAGGAPADEGATADASERAVVGGHGGRLALLPDLVSLPQAPPSPVAALPAIVSPEPNGDLELHVSDAVVGDDAVGLLASAVAAAPALTSLRAHLHGVSAVGAHALDAALRTPGLQLRVAELRFRKLQWDAAETLCSSVIHLPLLQSLTLRCCSLGDRGVEWLCSAFLHQAASSPATCALTLLDLNENGISDAGCVALAALVENHPSLRSLALEENRITAQGAFLLGRALNAHRGREARQQAEAAANTATSPSAQTGAVAPLPAGLEPVPSCPPVGLAAPTSLNTDAGEESAIQPFAMPVPFTPAAARNRERHRSEASLPAVPATVAEESDQLRAAPVPVSAARRQHVRGRSEAPRSFFRGGSSSHEHHASGAPSHSPSHSLHMRTDELSAALLLASTPASSAPGTRRPSLDTIPPHPCALQSLNLRFNRIDLTKPLTTSSPGVAAAAIKLCASSSAASSLVAALARPHSIMSRFLSVSPDLCGLTFLDLSLSAVGDAGATVLARGLAHNRTLENLSLSFAGVGERGGVALARSLAFNSSLHTLNLSLNSLSTRFSTALSDSLSVNTTLLSLDLSLNLMVDSSCWSLVDALALNDSLRTLLLTGNHIGGEGAHALAKATALNTSLKELRVDNNSMDESGEAIVAAALMDEQRGRHATRWSAADAQARRAHLQEKIAGVMAAEQQREEEAERRAEEADAVRRLR